MLKVYSYRLVSNEIFKAFYEGIKHQLTDVVRQKMQRFRFVEDRQRSLAGDLMVRRFYKESMGREDLVFEYNEQNKPFLKDCHDQYFNITHSGDFVLVAFSDRPVGIDVEKIGKDRSAIAKRFFTPEEIAQMNACETEEAQILFFYQLWTLKESYMKAIGKGMTMSLSSFSFLQKEDAFQLAYSSDDMDWHFYSQQWKESAFMSVCSKYNLIIDFQEMGIEDFIPSKD